VACHTKPGGEPFAGGAKMDTPFGPIWPPNLTPDKETGIGDWTDADFYRALHEGIRKNGQYLYPVFPFPWYTNVSKDDVLAIKAYLFSLKPVHAPNKPPGFSFPFDIRASLLTWRALFFKAGDDKPAPQGEGVERGKYLVTGLGHCGECHNHNAVLGASDWSGKYEGGSVEGWYAPNITADGKQGLGAWSEQDIATYLKTGAAPGKGVALGPMQETITDSLSHLKDEDLRSIALYLKSIPAKETYSNDNGSFAKKGAPGEALYINNCSSCHGLEGQGQGGRVPPLAHNGAVNAEGPENVIRAVVGGLGPTHGLGPMPALGQTLPDEDVARIADYVRNKFGNASPARTNPSMVARLRTETHNLMSPLSEQDCGDAAPKDNEALAEALKPIGVSNNSQDTSTIDGLIEKFKSSLGSSPDNVALGLTSAYCRVVMADAKADRTLRAQRIGQFAVLVYSRAHAVATN
jgi:mono/diheme cytochrome c family protein